MKPKYQQVHLDGTPSILTWSELKADPNSVFDETKDIADILREAGYKIAFDIKPKQEKESDK